MGTAPPRRPVAPGACIASAVLLMLRRTPDVGARNLITAAPPPARVYLPVLRR